MSILSRLVYDPKNQESSGNKLKAYIKYVGGRLEGFRNFSEKIS